MARVVYGGGGVTVAISGTLERTLREAVTAASKGLSDAIEALIDEVRDDAKQDWYEQVDKRTGQSQESISSEIRLTPGKITGVVFSTQKTTYMIKRPGALSVRSSRRLLDPQAYHEVRDFYRKNGKMPVGYTFARLDEDGNPVAVRKVVPNPKASDGRNMWLENIKKPGKKRIQQQIRNIEKAAKKAVKEASRG